MLTEITDLADADALLALSPEELSPVVLQTVIAGKDRGLPMHADSILYRIYQHERHAFEARFPEGRRKEVEAAVAEAWHGLVSAGGLMPEPGYNGNNGFMVLTSRGKEFVRSGKEFRGFAAGSALPKGMLHPSIAEPVWKALARGDLEIAVFEAVRAVEIAVRDAAGFPPEEVGVSLMRKAFHPKNGPLTNLDVPVAEREALANLFVGAIGYYKNPQSHRKAVIEERRKAQEIVLLATHLLHIVDEQRLV